MRAYYCETEDSNKAEIIFGPDVSTEAKEQTGYSGAISVSDARILLFPVRSLKGVFAYTTCPYVLKKLAMTLREDSNNRKLIMELVKLIEDTLVSENVVVVPSESKVVTKGKIVLEELLLNVYEGNKSGELRSKLDTLITFLDNFVPEGIDIRSHIVVTSDNVFKILTTVATEVQARIRIDKDKGVVESGALWYEEFLPSDTLLYTTILISKPKVKNNYFSTGADIKKELNKVFECKKIQIGGDETVGKGFSMVKIVSERGQS